MHGECYDVYMHAAPSESEEEDRTFKSSHVFRQQLVV